MRWDAGWGTWSHHSLQITSRGCIVKICLKIGEVLCASSLKICSVGARALIGGRPSGLPSRASEERYLGFVILWCSGSHHLMDPFILLNLIPGSRHIRAPVYSFLVKITSKWIGNSSNGPPLRGVWPLASTGFPKMRADAGSPALQGAVLQVKISLAPDACCPPKEHSCVKNWIMLRSLLSESKNRKGDTWSVAGWGHPSSEMTTPICAMASPLRRRFRSLRRLSGAGGQSSAWTDTVHV